MNEIKDMTKKERAEMWHRKHCGSLDKIELFPYNITISHDEKK